MKNQTTVLWVIQSISISLIKCFALLFISEIIYIPIIANIGKIILYAICFIIPILTNPEISLKNSIKEFVKI